MNAEEIRNAVDETRIQYKKGLVAQDYWLMRDYDLSQDPEIAAQLAELNETLKAANQLQKDLFGFELKPKDEHGAPALNEFLSGLKPMGPDGEPRS
jgi:hypothetical protein